MYNYRNNIDKDKNLKNYSECKKLIDKQDFERIGAGNQGTVYKAISPNCGSVVVKIYKINNRYKNYNNKTLIREYKITLMIQKLIEEYICPNYIKLIDFNYKKKYLVLEYADADCSSLFKNEIEFKIIKSFMCQSLIGLLCLHKYINVFHNDMPLSNILFKKINDDIIFCYKINNKNYYIPTYGYLFMIADFGASNYIDSIAENKKIINEKQDFDITRLSFYRSIIKKIAKKHDDNFSNFKEIFTLKNQNIINDFVGKNNNIEDFLIRRNFKKLSDPIFDNDGLIKNGINMDLINLIKILDNDSSLLKKLYEICSTNENIYKSEHIITFTINFN